MAEEKDTIGRDEPLNEEAPTPQTAGDAADAAPAADAPARAGKFDRLTQDEGGVRKLTGMYKNWFLDYASYVILERAVPHVEDGLKPVQRRILHAMKVVDDGRYNKVANIVGQTMQYHPHGDASIKDALVQLGQKDLLIDCQGNWGNILTGDEAAAGRYIEARLSKFASEVVFNKKTTEWMLSYDGRKEEPVTLPIKFPLLLAQGSDGIAVGLASKILPHNFVELINACIAHLEGREFQLYPDFPTGGMADVSRYNDGLRGGAVKVRAKISKIDKRTLAITEIPYTTTTESIKDSIIKANDKGKIKIRKVDDNTADKVEIIIQVSPDLACRVARTHFHREQALPAHRGLQEPRRGLRRRGQGARTVQETAAPRGHALRRAAPDGAEVHPHLALRQRQGRQRDPSDRGGHQGHAVRH